MLLFIVLNSEVNDDEYYSDSNDDYTLSDAIRLTQEEQEQLTVPPSSSLVASTQLDHSSVNMVIQL